MDINLCQAGTNASKVDKMRDSYKRGDTQRLHRGQRGFCESSLVVCREGKFIQIDNISDGGRGKTPELKIPLSELRAKVKALERDLKTKEEFGEILETAKDFRNVAGAAIPPDISSACAGAQSDAIISGQTDTRLSLSFI